jgi:hypothetical protein
MPGQVKKNQRFAPGLFFVDKMDAISNHSLIADMIRIIKLAEVFSK